MVWLICVWFCSFQLVSLINLLSAGGWVIEDGFGTLMSSHQAQTKLVHTVARQETKRGKMHEVGTWNLHTVISVVFYWLKQVTEPTQIWSVGGKSLPLDGAD